ncbi:hypothetical protein EU78_04510 [Mycolicibacterium rufum]|nr:hypothetical protein EU78_04510 [Mycolicibacterium rufum]
MSDGRQEHEVTVDLSRLLSKGAGRRQIVVGRSSLGRLERGDVTALFPHGLLTPADDESGDTAASTPLSPHYAPLQWESDADNLDDEDALAAASEDWTYRIAPIRGKGDHIIGYRVSGGDYESGDEFGSALVGGEVGELTLDRAKAVADANYAARFREAEGFLDGLLADWDDDDGPRTRRNEHGRLVCRIGESGLDEVEVVATLRDYGDGYDADGRSYSVCLRTLLSYSSNGDREGLVDEVRRLISLETRSRGR